MNAAQAVAVIPTPAGGQNGRAIIGAGRGLQKVRVGQVTIPGGEIPTGNRF
jgi:hypothetical protein